MITIQSTVFHSNHLPLGKDNVLDIKSPQSNLAKEEYKKENSEDEYNVAVTDSANGLEKQM